MTNPRLRLLELLAALSVATDLGMGQPQETALRSSLLATRLARAIELPEDEVRNTCLSTLLRHVGCTATASAEVRLYGGDELRSRQAADPADFGNPREMVPLMLSTGRGAGMRRPALLAKAVVGDLRHGTEILTSVCDAASMLARRLGLGRQVQECVGRQFERWDGKGPCGKAKGEVPIPARVGEVATQAVLFLDAGGPEAALAMVARRSGGWFDPDVAEAFCRTGADLMAELAAADPWQALLAAEPAPAAYIDSSDLDRVARCFADMAGLKSPSGCRCPAATPPRCHRRPRDQGGHRRRRSAGSEASSMRIPDRIGLRVTHENRAGRPRRSRWEADIRTCRVPAVSRCWWRRGRGSRCWPSWPWSGWGP